MAEIALRRATFRMLARGMLVCEERMQDELRDECRDRETRIEALSPCLLVFAGLHLPHAVLATSAGYGNRCKT